MDEPKNGEVGGWWSVAARWLEYEGELRVAVLRVLLVAAFYTVQLIHYLFFCDRSPAEQIFHRQASYLSASWLFVSLAVLVVVSRYWLPRALKYLSATADLLLLTAAAALGNAASSPLVQVLGLLIALAALRGSLPLVWFATIGSMLSYLWLVGLKDERWFDAVHATPPVQQMVVLLTLAAIGIATGQLLRMIRQVTQETITRHDRIKAQMP